MFQEFIEFIKNDHGNENDIKERIEEHREYVNFVDEKYNTALDYAFKRNNLFKVSCLIENGAYIFNINNITSDKIEKIIKEDQLNILHFLYVKDINIMELKNEKGETPLFVAVRIGNTNITKWLVDNGANINPITTRDSNIFNRNQQYNYYHNRKIYEEIQYILFKRIFKSIKKHEVKALPFYFKNGINKNIRNDENESLLDVALKTCHYRLINSIEIVDYLIEMGCNEFHKENITASAVTGIIMNDKINSLKFFIQHGLDIEMKNKINWTPLFIAILFNNIEMIKLLIENNANINHRCRKGRTPLFNAIKYHQPNIVKFLLEHGAIMDDKDEENQNVHDFNKKYNEKIFSREYQKIEELLLERKK